MSKRMIGNGMLLTASMIWGAAFVAQTVGLDYVGPFTFQATRCLLAFLVLLPVIAIMDRKGMGKKPSTKSEQRDLWLYGCICGTILFIACGLQQIGLQYTEAGKAGFLTSLYIIIVPLVGLFFRQKVSPFVWMAAMLALIGLYLLCSGDMAMGTGEISVLLCSAAFAAHILVVDHISPRVDGVRLSCIQFLVCTIISATTMLFTEEPSLAAMGQCWLPISYAGILSAGMGYTLQILGQARTAPTIASLLMSLESVFSMLFGWLILGQVLSPKEMLGCGLVFSGVILAQVPDRKHAKST